MPGQQQPNPQKIGEFVGEIKLHRIIRTLWLLVAYL